MRMSESAALWQMYAGRVGVSIVATAGALGAALPADMPFGRLRYIDYEKDSFPGQNVLYPFVHKRRSFEHEREVRALQWQHAGLTKGPFDDAHAPTDAGIWLHTGLDFISEIRVLPSAEEWFEEVVRGVIARYALSVPVIRSRMDAAPLF